MIPKTKPMKAPIAIVRVGFGWVWTGVLAAMRHRRRELRRIVVFLISLCTVSERMKAVAGLSTVDLVCGVVAFGAFASLNLTVARPCCIACQLRVQACCAAR